MRYVLLLAAALLLASCVGAPVTPVVVIKYPDTWTPAPTATNTPPAPTATLVVQHTPGPTPTRDPNFRDLPSIPQTGIGIWLDTSGIAADSLKLLIPRSQVLVTNGVITTTRSANNSLLLAVDSRQSNPLNEPLPLRYDGIFLENATNVGADVIAAYSAEVAPRLLIRSIEIPQTTPAEVVTQTITLGKSDGWCYCNFLKQPNSPADSFLSETEWLHDVNTLASLSSTPNAVVLTATRFPDDATDDFDVMQGWLNYALGSYLLGIRNTHSFFSFQGKGTEPFVGAQELVTRIGTPTSDVFHTNGVYQRRFTRGLALVNPTTETRTFLPSRNYVTINGSAFPQIKMPPHSGLILLLTR